MAESDPPTCPKERVSKFKRERQQMRLLEACQANSSSSTSVPSVNSDLMKKLQQSYDLFDPFKTNSSPVGQCHQPRTSNRKAVAGAGDTSFGEKIHPLLQGYTEAEILQERNSLLKHMKPETLEIFKKRKAVAAEVDARNAEVESKPVLDKACVKAGRSPDVAEDQHLEIGTEVKHFPHMDSIEEEKLQWTKPIEINNHSNESENQDRKARFAFNGEMITEKLEKNPETWDQGLHHHGEEMERPGYSIEELFTLSRSTFPQQRALGRNVLAEIFKRSHNGEFDFVLDPSIFQACNEFDFIHVLRIGADSRDSLSLNASINCIAALLFPEHEELFLDIVFSWPNSEPQPWLDLTDKSVSVSSNSATAETEEEVKESELKDFQVVKNDLLDFLITRTDIITRFHYILRDMIDLLNEAGVQGILKVLIRIARHSPNKIMECKEILENIQKHFMVPNWSDSGETRPVNMSGVPLPEAIKLFRLLVASSHQNAKILYEVFYPFSSVMSYLAYNKWDDQKLIKGVGNLVFESFNLWEAFLSYGYGLEEYTSLFPVIMNFFQTVYRCDVPASFDLAHAAHIHSLISKVFKALSASPNSAAAYSGIKECIGFISSFVVKMLAMLGRENTSELLDREFSEYAILTGLECLSLAREYEKFAHVDAAIKKFVQTPAYAAITNCLTNHSLLLFSEPSSDNEKENSKYPSNMTSSGAILYGGFQVPIMTQGSPFVFLTSVFRYAEKQAEKERKELSEFMIDDNCRNYILQLSKKNLQLRINSFLRFELYCAHELLKWLKAREQLIPAYKMLPHLQTGDEELCKEILKTFIKCSGIPQPDEIFMFYSKFLFIPSLDENPYNFKKLSSKLLTTGWITEPLNILFKALNETKPADADQLNQIHEIARVGVEMNLDFLIYALQNFESVIIPRASSIPAIYMRVALAFMMGHHIFLDTKIRSQLKVVLELFLSHKFFKTNSPKSLFSKYKMEGSSVAFNTFYSELLTEYSANSFGDEVFGAYVTLPLRTPESAHLKSLFWNDQCIQFFRTKVDESPVSLEYFTSLPELDRETLLLYQRALRSKRITAERNPFLHAVADYHVTRVKEAEKNKSTNPAGTDMTSPTLTKIN